MLPHFLEEFYKYNVVDNKQDFEKNLLNNLTNLNKLLTVYDNTKDLMGKKTISK